MTFKDPELLTVIPTKIVGPLKMQYLSTEHVSVPLATYEIPLWSSVKRGALVSQRCTDGILVSVIDDIMTRSVIVEAGTLKNAIACKNFIDSNFDLLSSAVASTSNYANLKHSHVEIIASMLYIRLSIFTSNAAGHNIVTKAADAVLDTIIDRCNVKYISISGNICSDKKSSSINGILGRGKRVSAEITVPYDTCLSILKTTPEKIVDLNIRKNLIGSILAGGTRTANAHYANIILACYLATGQDGANVVESSQGITYAEVRNNNLYFSVNIPNIIVGTVGNGKDLNFAHKNLELLGCTSNKSDDSKRLSAIIASAVLCSELSLLAAQTNKGELMMAHISLERSK